MGSVKKGEGKKAPGLGRSVTMERLRIKQESELLDHSETRKTIDLSRRRGTRERGRERKGGGGSKVRGSSGGVESW